MLIILHEGYPAKEWHQPPRLLVAQEDQRHPNEVLTKVAYPAKFGMGKQHFLCQFLPASKMYHGEKVFSIARSLIFFCETAGYNKPGTAQVGAISEAQKEQKDFKVSSILFYSTRMRKKIFYRFFLSNFFWSGKSHSAEKCKR